MPLPPTIKIAPEGPVVSPLIQGYWRMAQWQRSRQEHARFITQHAEMGITTVDHAHVYGAPPCEKLFGDAIKLCPHIKDKIQIVSKCGINVASLKNTRGEVTHYDASKENIISSVDTSLSRLGADKIDMLLIHRPDLLLNTDEVAEAFGYLRQSGKVLHFGVSNFSVTQFSGLQDRLDVPLATNQLEINPLNMQAIENGTLDQLQALKVRPMAWSCLAGGRLFSTESKQILRTKKTLQEVAEEVGASSLDQVLFAWVLRLPCKPIPIIGSGKIQRTISAVKSLELNLNREQWYRIWGSAKGHGVV